MMRHLTLVLLLISLFSQVVNAQIDQTLQGNSSDFIGDANALILLDSGITEVSEDFGLLSYQLQRTKILNEDGLKYSTIEFPFTDEDSLIFIKAVHYKPTKEKKLIIKEYGSEKFELKRFPENQKLMRFNIPNVEVNDVVELSYRVKSSSLENMNPWYFQTSLPVLRSVFTSKVPSFIFYYKFLEGLRKLNDLKRTIVQDELNGNTFNYQLETFEMKQIPAYQAEPDTPGDEYFISKIDFHLAEYTLPGKETRYLLPSSYEDLGINWASDPYFNQISESSEYLKEKIKQVYHPKFSDEKNIQSFYFFIRNNWTIDNSLYDKELFETYKRRAGNEQQVNMLLAKMLNQAGYNASMVALSTIDNRPTYPEYPYFSLFNKLIVMVRTYDQTYFLDATDPHLLFNMLTPNSITNGALIISKLNNGLFPLSYLFDDAETVNTVIQVTDTATIKVNYSNTREGYSVYLFDSQYLENYKSYNDYLIETIFNHPKWNNVLHSVEDDFSQNKMIQESLTYDLRIGAKNDQSLEFSPIVLNDFIVNPYPQANRQNPITVYTPLLHTGSYTIKSPSGYRFTSIPKAIELSLGDDDAIFKYMVSEEKGSINIRYELKTNKIIYMPSEYKDLSAFFESVSKSLSQKIKLTRN